MTIPATAPAPRPELLVDEGVKTDWEEEIVDFADVDNANGEETDVVIVTRETADVDNADGEVNAAVTVIIETAGVAKDEGIGA